LIRVGERNLLLNKEYRDLAEPTGILLLHFDVESYIIVVVYNMDIVLDNRGKQGEDEHEMIPFFSIASRDL
jgi:hypothetical protein